jgi:hypothetical protein
VTVVRWAVVGVEIAAETAEDLADTGKQGTGPASKTRHLKTPFS